LGDDRAGAGIAELRGNLRKGDEDEGALVETRVRNFKGGFVQNEVTINDHVEIESARAVGDSGGTVAAEFVFNSQKRTKEFERGEQGFEGNDGVEEAVLAGEADRGSGVERGAGGNASKSREAIDSSGKCCVGRTGGAGQVRAEGDVGEGHGFQNSGLTEVTDLARFPEPLVNCARRTGQLRDSG
jgi:hypothetical protein